MEDTKHTTFVHDHGDGHIHTHEIGHIHDGHHHNHSHTHDPQKIKAIMNRISKSIGHMESIKKMLENQRDCADVLIQLVAVRAEINNTGKLLLKEHMEHCIVEAVRENDQEAITRMNQAIDMFMK